MKKLSKVKYIVVHCSATTFIRTFKMEQIRDWHVARGFSTIGYHFVVEQSGDIREGRDLSVQGAHVRGYNDCSIGVCYVGGLDAIGRPADTRTEMQKESLIRLLTCLHKQYPEARIVGHRDLSPDLNGDGIISPDEYIKQCPCFDAEIEYKHITDNWENA